MQSGASFALSAIALDAAIICEVRNSLFALPALTLDKSTDQELFASAGAVITYSYVLTNSGNVPLYPPYTVRDDKTTVTCPATPSALLPGESVACTARYTATEADELAEQVTNVAQGSAKDRDGADVVSNEDAVTVPYTLEPAGLPGIDQPAPGRTLFLPSVQARE